MVRISTTYTKQIEDHPASEAKSLILRESYAANELDEETSCSFAKGAVQNRTVHSQQRRLNLLVQIGLAPVTIYNTWEISS
jgi:hypothetical protein